MLITLSLARRLIAVLLKAMGHLAQARPLYERVLKGDMEQLGASHPHTPDSIYNLARLHQAEGDVAKALPLFQQELEGCAALYGPAHQETATSARNLRALYLQVGQEANAAELTRRFELAEEIS